MGNEYLDVFGLRRFLNNLRAERPVIELTSVEYEALEQAGEVDPKALYFITDSDVPGRNPDAVMSSTSTNTVQNKVIKAYVDGQLSALRTELMAVINSITGMAVSDTAPSDTSKVWIDTGGN